MTEPSKTLLNNPKFNKWLWRATIANFIFWVVIFLYGAWSSYTPIYYSKEEFCISLWSNMHLCFSFMDGFHNLLENGRAIFSSITVAFGVLGIFVWNYRIQQANDQMDKVLQQIGISQTTLKETQKENHIAHFYKHFEWVMNKHKMDEKPYLVMPIPYIFYNYLYQNGEREFSDTLLLTNYDGEVKSSKNATLEEKVKLLRDHVTPLNMLTFPGFLKSLRANEAYNDLHKVLNIRSISKDLLQTFGFDNQGDARENPFEKKLEEALREVQEYIGVLLDLLTYERELDDNWYCLRNIKGNISDALNRLPESHCFVAHNGQECQLSDLSVSKLNQMFPNGAKPEQKGPSIHYSIKYKPQNK